MASPKEINDSKNDSKSIGPVRHTTMIRGGACVPYTLIRRAAARDFPNTLSDATGMSNADLPTRAAAMETGAAPHIIIISDDEANGDNAYADSVHSSPSYSLPPCLCRL
ncbi:hypothetical protein C5167_020695 [Papaver somniferum]|uniref:Uncharacterized protein n=1 Tax=Papaver somniferum TaxID=3469 RepID=A0A4Y7ITQ7_PAPSO|nr:hypothetical protein C5167_020695 [Papaver somniferum]